MGDRTRATLRLAAWSAALVVAGRLLLAAGGDDLSMPLTSLDAVAAWADRTPAPDMAIAVLRLAGLAACAYLLAVTALSVLAQSLGLRSLRTTADRLSPRIVRRLMAGGSGVGLALGAVVGALPVPDLAVRPPTATVAAAPEPDPALRAEATMTRVASPGQREAPTADGGADPVAADTAEATMTRVEPSPASATMRRVAPAATTEAPTTTTPPTSTTGPTPATGQSVAADSERPAAAPRSPRPVTSAGAPTRPAGATPATGLPAAPPLPAIDPDTWTVHPGDSLWSIAVEVVQTDAGEASERALSAYWRALVAENRSRLVDPDNPDLLLAGQRLVLPPTTGAAG